MGAKFLSEIPQWRRNEGEPTQDATFSLGRMMNSVGGSIIHYGGWMRRFHPHHFKMLSYVKDRWGLSVLPEGCTLADWPFTYEEIEPYYSLLEHEIGIAGDSSSNFVPRSKPYPMPPMRPFRMGELFRQASEELGLHALPVPVGVNTVPYRRPPSFDLRSLEQWLWILRGRQVGSFAHFHSGGAGDRQPGPAHSLPRPPHYDGRNRTCGWSRIRRSLRHSARPEGSDRHPERLHL